MPRVEQTGERVFGKFRRTGKDDAHGRSDRDVRLGVWRGTTAPRMGKPSGRGHFVRLRALAELLGELGPNALLLELRKVFDEHLSP